MGMKQDWPGGFAWPCVWNEVIKTPDNTNPQPPGFSLFISLSLSLSIFQASACSSGFRPWALYRTLRQCQLSMSKDNVNVNE